MDIMKLTGKLKVLLLAIILGSGWPLAAQDTWEGVGKVIAVGDVHGDYDNFVEVLRQAGVVNRRGNWIADDAHFVQLGDLPDRGPDTGKAIELLKKLEGQAEDHGGRVHALIGNHEAMNMLGDLRYVHPGEYEAFVSRDSSRLRERYYELVVQQRSAADPLFEATDEFRSRFEQEIAPGFVEHRIAWAPDGEYGSWVLGHKAVVRIDDTLFVHGGIGPDVLGMSLDQINAAIHDELAAGEAGQTTEPGLATSEGGPLWYRGLASNDEMEELSHLEAVLEFYQVERIVIGHTPGLATIVPRFDARVLVIDSGLSGYYGGHLASLVIEGENLTNIQRGEPLKIPADNAGLVPYFEAVLKLEPDHAGLKNHLNMLEGAE